MCITWGSMMTKAELVQARLTLRENAELEMECYEQAKAECKNLDCDPIAWIRKVAARAQEIKAAKHGK